MCPLLGHYSYPTPSEALGTRKPLLILAPVVKRWGPLRGRVYVAKLFTLAPLLILLPALKRRGHPNGMVSVAKQPSCGPLVIPFPAVKRWGHHTFHSEATHLWATVDSLSRCEVTGTPHVGDMHVANLLLWAN